MPHKIKPIRIEGNVAYVPLTKGYEAMIDAADLDLVSGHNWNAKVSRKKDGSIKTVYAARSIPKGEGRRKEITMHRIISGVADHLEADHCDSNGLNNRRANLRSATRSQNQCNARLKSTNTSGARGVSWHKATKKWLASIKINGKRKHLGVFDSVADAAGAYSAASVIVHGEFGRTE